MHKHEEKGRKKLASEDVLIDPYAVLGLERTASAAEIKKAYFEKVREFPPEREAETFKQIRAAYEMLRNPEAKAATDLLLLQMPLSYEGYKRPPVFNLDVDSSDWLEALEACTDLGLRDFNSDYRTINL